MHNRRPFKSKNNKLLFLKYMGYAQSVTKRAVVANIPFLLELRFHSPEVNPSKHHLVISPPWDTGNIAASLVVQ